ncbi:hypothetical protein ACFVDQ_18585 [Streptomyces sp. NPDC057684]|uniref:hypothetical protein n=1 Tax=Streptomyces sp. NPDC057684 TaxID=3346211 RepID=UPI0036C3BF58
MRLALPARSSLADAFAAVHGHPATPFGPPAGSVCLSGLDEAGAVLATVLHPAGHYPDTAMSVAIDKPISCTAVAANLQQLRAVRFAETTHRGTVDPRPWPASTRPYAPPRPLTGSRLVRLPGLSRRSARALPSA